AGNVVVATTLSFPPEPPGGRVLTATTVEPTLPSISRGAAASAHVNVLPDPDGVVRTVPAVAETADGELIPSLSLSLALLERGEEGGPVTFRTEAVQVGPLAVPTGRASLMNVNFSDVEDPDREPGSRPHVYSAIDVLEGNTPPGEFRDRIVLVGATAIGLGDIVDTPLDRAEGEPGVYIHASALNTILQSAYLEPAGIAVTLTSVFLVALLVALSVAFLWAWLAPLVSAAILALYYLFAFSRFDRGSVMNLVWPGLAALLAYLAALAFRYLTEVRERRRVTQTFSRYVAGDIVDEVLASPEVAMATLRGASRPLSVLFADLRGFTSASEGAAPEDVVAALNVYLDAMTRAVSAERGTIDKFMGDCVMAFWGAPRAEPEHAENAVRSAMRMLDEIDRAVEQNPDAAHLRVAGCGVGISTGPAVVGNIGSHERLDYTVIGDTVNTASRICGVADAGQIVVTRECADALGDGFRIAPLPPLKVKGKVQPLEVFQVLREGQEPASFAEGATLDATEEKGHFEEEAEKEAEVVQAPPKAAGYAPIEPKPVDE
ncbi:MAG TPA: adenylate/guanylate cyclase domain-containing protein, partial [Actinomycetota bacterium]|nr:adenylate/guanylate cyclase domain-containing protein [Actinomycetota bacterium]